MCNCRETVVSVEVQDKKAHLRREPFRISGDVRMEIEKEIDLKTFVCYKDENLNGECEATNRTI